MAKNASNTANIKTYSSHEAIKVKQVHGLLLQGLYVKVAQTCLEGREVDGDPSRHCQILRQAGRGGTQHHKGGCQVVGAQQGFKLKCKN